MSEIDEQFYEVAAHEVAAARFVPGLIAKAFSDADGDKEKTIARYIRLRVEQLQREFQAEVEKSAVAAERERVAADQRRREAEERRRRRGDAPDGYWECKCGKVNLDGVAHCSCGRVPGAIV